MSVKKSPQRLLQLLQSVTKGSTNVPHQLFRGFYNYNKIPNQDQNYCYVISFFFLFFHCPSVINYFKTQNISNTQEKFLKNIFNEIFIKIIIQRFILMIFYCIGQDLQKSLIYAIVLYLK